MVNYTMTRPIIEHTIELVSVLVQVPELHAPLKRRQEMKGEKRERLGSNEEDSAARHCDSRRIALTEAPVLLHNLSFSLHALAELRLLK